MSGSSIDHDGLWRHVLAVLEAAQDGGVDAAYNVSQIAALYDTLSNGARHQMAEQMLEIVKRYAYGEEPFSPVVRNVLRLTFPFFVRTDYASDARLHLEGLFRPEIWQERPFEEVSAVGLSLAELGFRSGSSEAGVWQDFYDAFKHSERTRVPAFDVALSGLVSRGLKEFATFINAEGYAEWVEERWMAHLPTLASRHPHEFIVEYVSKFLRTAPPNKGTGLKNMAHAMSLNLTSASEAPRRESPRRVIELAPTTPIPPELVTAETILASELRQADGPQLQSLLESSHVEIICRTSVAMPPAMTLFVNEAQARVSKLAALLPPPPQTQPPRPNEMPKQARPDSNSRYVQSYDDDDAEPRWGRKVAYAYPMILTEERRRQGFSVCPLGQHRRLGVAVPVHHPLAARIDELGDLGDLLLDACTTDSEVWCYGRETFSIVRREAEMHASALGDRAWIRMAARAKDLKSYGVEISRERSDQNFAVVFNLEDVETMRRLTSRQQLRADAKWIFGARIAEVAHSQNLPFGIGFNLHAVRWLLERGRAPQSAASQVAARPGFGPDPRTNPPREHWRWTEIQEWCLERRANPELVDCFRRMGIDFDTPPPADTLSKPDDAAGHAA